jgi:L-ascorbate metabolism protein UlaG (beta-lactamase superfamily)
MQLTWLGHHSFKIVYERRVIYIDPYQGEYDASASLVLISKNDYDHWSRSVLKQIMVDDTHIIAEKEVAKELYGCRSFSPGEFIVFEDGTRVQATKAILKRRKETIESLGWLLTIEGKTLYFAGDTDVVADGVHDPDLAILPVGGTWTMNAKAAAAAAKIINPKHALPAHYGKTAGTKDDALLFKELAAPIDVIILAPGQSLDL